MADSATSILSFVLPEVGASANTWGGKLNDNLEDIDALFAKATTVSTTSGTVSLTADQQTTASIKCTGTLVGNLVLQFNRAGLWFVYNGTSGAYTLTVQISGQSSPPTIVQGGAAMVMSDGTDCRVTSATLAGVVASGALSFVDWTNVASATTTDIGAVASNFVNITGTTTITGLGTVAAGAFRIVKFAGALTFTHNGTSLILPGSANITTAANDIAFLKSEGSGNWRCLAYWKANGLPNVMATAAEYRVGTAVKPIGVDQAWAAQAEVTISYASSVAPDWSTFNDAVITLTGPITLANGSNLIVGKKGRIRFVQDATGSRTIAFGTDYEFAGGTAITLSTAANAQDILYYDIIAAGRVLLSAVKAIS